MRTPTLDQLFLLKPFFADAKSGEGLFHCPFSCRVEGLLSFYPFLRARMEVRYLDFSHPRQPLVDLLGPEHQSCPVLVLAEGAPDGPGVAHSPTTGRRFVADSGAIASYLAARHGIPAPHP
jgi:hypothetical protein